MSEASLPITTCNLGSFGFGGECDDDCELRGEDVNAIVDDEHGNDDENGDGF